MAMDEPAEINSTEWLSGLVPFIPNGVGSLKWDGTLEKWLRDPSPKAAPLPSCDPALIDRPNHNRHRNDSNINNRYTRLKDDPDKNGQPLPIVTGTVSDGRPKMPKGNVQWWKVPGIMVDVS